MLDLYWSTALLQSVLSASQNFLGLKVQKSFTRKQRIRVYGLDYAAIASAFGRSQIFNLRIPACRIRKLVQS